MDGGTNLIDIWQIQGQNSHFNELGDDFVWSLQIQGRIWLFTQESICEVAKSTIKLYV